MAGYTGLLQDIYFAEYVEYHDSCEKRPRWFIHHGACLRDAIEHFDDHLRSDCTIQIYKVARDGTLTEHMYLAKEPHDRWYDCHRAEWRMGALRMKAIAYTALRYGRDYYDAAIRSVIDAVSEYHVLYAVTPSHGHWSDAPCPETEDELRAIAEARAAFSKLWTKPAYETTFTSIFRTCFVSAPPGTGTGGLVVVEIATLLLGSLKVTKPTATPFGSEPDGSPFSKSSTRGNPAARTDPVADMNVLRNRLKISRVEKAAVLVLIVFLLMILLSECIGWLNVDWDQFPLLLLSRFDRI